jgi:tetratricopeptide (TPR) repeat protein
MLLAGLLSKEAMLAAVPAVGLWLCLRRGVSWRHILAPAGAVLVFLGLRAAALGGLEATGSGAEQRLLAIKHLPVLLLDGLHATVLMRPIGPRHLWFEYRELSWVASGLALALLILLAVAVWLLRRRCPLLELGAGVFLLGLAPVALVSTVPGWGGFARYLYLPWAFGACAAVQLGRELWRRLAEREQACARVGIVLLAGLMVGWLSLQQVGLRRALLVYSSQEELARAAVAIDPDGPPGQEWLANVFLEQGDLSRALEHYRLAVAGDPELYRPRLNTAACLLHLNRPGEALDEIAGLEAQHGMTVKSTLVAVRALVRLRRTREARARLTRALEIAPDSPLLRQLEGELEHVVPDGPPGERQVAPGRG